MNQYDIRPASSEHDSEVMGLFRHLGLDIDPVYWERAYSAEQGDKKVARPWILFHRSNGVIGFASLRPRTLALRKERVKCQLLFDFVIHPSETQNDGVGFFLKELIAKSELTFAAGMGLEPSRLLERERFMRAGVMERFVFDPSVDELSVPTKSLPVLEQTDKFPGNIQNMFNHFAQHEIYHFERSRDWMHWMHKGPASISREILKNEVDDVLRYLLVSRTVDCHPSKGEGKREMQITDAYCLEDHVEEMGHALAARAIKRKMPVYMSFFGGKYKIV